MQDLVNKDEDGDGVLDWEESLWGTDINNKDTFGNGLGDKAEIEKIKAENNANRAEADLGPTPATNTETDKFAKELFATVATLNQNGQMDQATVDKITDSLALRIQNSVQRKIFTKANIKITTETGKVAATKYNEALNTLYKKYPINGDVIAIFNKLNTDEDTADPKTVALLDPIIRQTTLFVDGMTKINTPSFLVKEHLAMLNSLEGIVENLTDVKLINTDIIVALTGISQYDKNSDDLQNAVTNLSDAITKALNN